MTIRVSIKLDLALHYFPIFVENNENERIMFGEFYVREHLAKGRHPNDQQQNKITYSI